MFLFLEAKVTVVRGRTLNREVAYAKFKAHKFSYLNITSIGSDYVMKDSECGLACVNTPSCFSFNLAAFHDVIGNLLCELLPSDMYNSSDKLVYSSIRHHYGIMVSDRCKTLHQLFWAMFGLTGLKRNNTVYSRLSSLSLGPFS